MAVARMRKVTILALKERESDILEILRDLGIMQVIKAEPISLDNGEDSPFSKETMAKAPWVAASDERSSSEVPLEWTERLSKLSFMKSYCERYNMIRKGFIDMFTGKKPEIAEDTFKDLVSHYDIDGTFQAFTSHDSRLKEITKEILDIDSKTEMLAPWAPLDVPLSDLGPTDTCETILAIVPSSGLPELSQILKGTCVYQVVFEKKAETGLWVLVSKDESLSLSNSLVGVGGTIIDLKRFCGALSGVPSGERAGGPAVGGTGSTIKGALDTLSQARESLSHEMKRIQAEDLEKSKDLVPIMALMDYYEDKKNLKETEKRFALTKFTFIVEGFVRAKDVQRLRAAFARKEEVEILDEEPGPDDEVPIYLENHPLIRPFEVITNIFGYPHYNEIDPTPILAPFFWIFFGICLADAVYGIVLSIVCWYFMKTQKLGDGGKKLVTLLMYSGVSTFIMGVLMGSWMGDLPSVFLKGTVIEQLVLKMTILNPIEDPLTLLGVSFAFGIFQIWVGIIVKMIGLIRSGEIYEGILSQGSWVLFLPGLVGFALSKAGLIKSNIPLYIMALGAFMVMYSASRGQKNILLKPFAGLYGLYGTIGYFSDTMSYARLLALGLASAVIAVVINKIAQLVAGMIPIVGWVLVPFILLGGHVFNLVINVLGSFIHSGRLQFVEFFTKFFEGGGKPFKPLTRVNELVSVD